MLHTETGYSDGIEVSKSQTIRLLDVFFIAPFLLYITYKAKGISEAERLVLLGIALATFYYNAYNFLKNKNESNES